MNYFINAGPFIGFLIKETDQAEVINIGNAKKDHTDLYKRFDTGISAGVGIAIPIKEKFIFTCEVRNNLGLYNVNIPPKTPVVSDGTIKTNSTNLLFGFAYKIGKKRNRKLPLTGVQIKAG